MSSSLEIQEKVALWGARYPDKVIPGFGVHPWFTHLISTNKTDGRNSSSSTISDLKSIPSSNSNSDTETKKSHYISIGVLQEDDPPDYVDVWPEPIMLNDFIIDLRKRLEKQPQAIVGEIGLDGVFKVKPYLARKVSLEHQLTIAKAQLDVAIELQRPVSMHSVRCIEPTVKLLSEFAPRALKAGVNICLHSFIASTETIKQIVKVHSNVYFSFSQVINYRARSKFNEALLLIPLNRILVESDIDCVEGQDEFVAEIFTEIAHQLNVPTDSLARTLKANWVSFLNNTITS